MPPRVVNAAEAGGGVGAWYQSLPPVTRTWATLCFLMSLGTYVGVVNPTYLALVGPWVWRRYEVWRLASHLTFIAPFSMTFVFEMMWLLQYGSILEKQTFMFAPADFVFMLLFGGGLLTAISLLAPSLGLVFCASPLIFMLLYVYSRNFPTQQVSIMGLFTVQSFYLPFVFLGVSVVFGKNPLPDICGIVAGHAWYFLKDLYPAQGGPVLLNTPRWLRRAVANVGVGPPPAPDAATGAPAGFSAFRGRGRRLGAHEE